MLRSPGMIRDIVIPGLQAPGNPLNPKTLPCIPQPCHSPTNIAGNSSSDHRSDNLTRLVHSQTIHILPGTGSISCFCNKVYGIFFWPEGIIVWLSVKHMAYNVSVENTRILTCIAVVVAPW